MHVQKASSSVEVCVCVCGRHHRVWRCVRVGGIIKCQGVQSTVKLWGNAALVGSYVLIDSLLACEKRCGVS